MTPSYSLGITQAGLFRQVMFAGYSVRVEGRSSQVMRLIHIFLSGLRYTEIPATAQSLLGKEFRVYSDKPSFDQRLGRVVKAAPHWHCYVDEHQAWFVFEDATVVIPRPKRGRAERLVEVYLSPARNRWSPDVLGQVFGCAVHAVLQPRGLHFLHGAGLIAPDSETGLLIVGASGSGKSSLAVRLIASGWQYLTDDLMLIQQDAAAITAHAFRRTFAVSDEALVACDLPRGAVAARSKRGKRWLCPDTLFPDRYAARCVPQVLLFPHLTGDAASRLEPLTPHDALLYLLQETPLVNYDPTITRAQVQTMTKLAAQTRAWRLYAGRDLLEEPDRATQLMASLL